MLYEFEKSLLVDNMTPEFLKNRSKWQQKLRSCIFPNKSMYNTNANGRRTNHRESTYYMNELFMEEVTDDDYFVRFNEDNLDHNINASIITSNASILQSIVEAADELSKSMTGN